MWLRENRSPNELLKTALEQLDMEVVKRIMALDTLEERIEA